MLYDTAGFDIDVAGTVQAFVIVADRCDGHARQKTVLPFDHGDLMPQLAHRRGCFQPDVASAYDENVSRLGQRVADGLDVCDGTQQVDVRILRGRKVR